MSNFEFAGVNKVLSALCGTILAIEDFAVKCIYHLFTPCQQPNTAFKIFLSPKQRESA